MEYICWIFTDLLSVAAVLLVGLSVSFRAECRNGRYTHTHKHISVRFFGQLLMSQSLQAEIYRKGLKADGSLDAPEEEVKSEIIKA